jgi:hypothetical protein
MRKSVYTEVEVDVDIDLEDFTDQELLEELKDRNLNVGGNVREAERLLEEIYYKRVMGKDFTAEIDRYLYETIGRIV